MSSKKISQYWQIICNEEQLELISKALENYSRRLAGQFSRHEDIVIKDLVEKRLSNSNISDCQEFNKDLHETLLHLKRLLFPEFEDGSGSYSFNHTPEIGNSYQIYRTINHVLTKENQEDSVYRRSPLPSGTLGTIKVEKIKRNYGKEQ